MKKIIKIILLWIVMLLSINISFVQAERYHSIESVDIYNKTKHWWYSWWAAITKSVVDHYLDGIWYDPNKIDINELKDKVARIYAWIQAWTDINWDGIPDSYNDVYNSKMNHRRSIVRYENGILIVWCGNLDLISYTLAPPTSCSTLSYEDSINPIVIWKNKTIKTVSCSALNAKKIQIDCWNGKKQTFSWNEKWTKTVTKYCRYTKAGKYTQKCIVNDSITNNSCIKKLDVILPTCDKLWYSDSINPIVIWNDRITKTISCKATNANQIKIDCWNWVTETFFWITDEKKIVYKDCTYSKVWTYNPKCIVNETISSNNCNKEIKVKEKEWDCESLVVNKDNWSYTCRWDSNTTSYKLFLNNTEVSTDRSWTFNLSSGWDFKLECIVNWEERPADDTCTVNFTDLEPKFDLALRKTTITEAPYNIWDIIEYKIEVINQGWIDANNVEITDYIPNNMELIVENGWSAMDSNRKTINKIVSVPANAWSNSIKFKTIKLKILSSAKNWISLTNYAEISDDSYDKEDCDSIDDNQNGNSDWEDVNENLIDDDIWNACNIWWDEDDHDIEEIMVGWKFDLALVKRVETWLYNLWDIVPYVITVYNQWDIPAKNIEVTDYIPVELELVPWNGWSTPVWRQTRHDVFDLPIWWVRSLTINLKIISWNNGDIIKNFSEITEDNATDCDSEADNINGNWDWETINLDDNNFWSKCSWKWNWDEDDHDIEVLIIWKETWKVCKSLVTGSLSFPINSSKQGLCEEDWETVTDFVEWTSHKTTTYAWKCKDWSWKVFTGWNCNASYTTGGGTSSHGWSNAECYNIEKSSNQYTCTWNSNIRSIWIDCDWDWIFEQAVFSDNRSAFIKDWTAYSYIFTCNPWTNIEWEEKILKPKCWVSKNRILPNQKSGWLSSLQCKYKPSNYCWDWIIQNPNSNWKKEECDLGSKNWPNSSCSSSCTLNPRHVSYRNNCWNSWSYYIEHKDDICKNKTLPSGWELAITTVSNFAIGHNQKVFNYDDVTNVYSLNSKNIVDSKALLIKNIWDTPMYFEDNLCLFDRWNKWEIKYNDVDFNWSNRDIISGKNSYCENGSIWYLYSWQTKYLNSSKLISNVDEMKWNTSGFWTGKIKTSHLVLTIQNGWSTYDWSTILAGQMYITVAKSSIANQWWWTAYLADNAELSNVNDIAKTINDHNKNINAEINTKQNNFVATVLGWWDNLSDINTINNISLIKEAMNESDTIEKDAISMFNTSDNIRNSWNLNSFIPYKWMDNVVFIKDTNITIWNIALNKNKTYIIENWDLIIEWNIESIKNVAFIVKNGDIIIKENVTNIDGTYINISWKVKSDSTSNKLIINGSLYGDLSELTSNRTHISMDKKWNISVWTVVSYSSNILNKPAPLVWQFIGEYMNSQKIAQ